MFTLQTSLNNPRKQSVPSTIALPYKNSRNMSISRRVARENPLKLSSQHRAHFQRQRSDRARTKYNDSSRAHSARSSGGTQTRATRTRAACTFVAMKIDMPYASFNKHFARARRKGNLRLLAGAALAGRYPYQKERDPTLLLKAARAIFPGARASSIYPYDSLPGDQRDLLIFSSADRRVQRMKSCRACSRHSVAVLTFALSGASVRNEQPIPGEIRARAKKCSNAPLALRLFNSLWLFIEATSIFSRELGKIVLIFQFLREQTFSNQDSQPSASFS